MDARVKVLVVDDCVDAAGSMAALATLWGYAVEVCYDGAAALETVARGRPDVVLLDIGLPTMDGFEVAERLRAPGRSRDVLLIGVTGWGGKRYSARARELGFDHYLLKPVDLELLQGLLARVARVTSDEEAGDMSEAPAEGVGAAARACGGGESAAGGGPLLSETYGWRPRRR